MINIFPPNEADPDWVVWSDTEAGEKDGRCMGVGKTRAEALKNAVDELTADLNELHRLSGVPR